MQALRFDAAVDNIIKRDDRFDSGAYFFLQEALDFTLKRAKEANNGENRHVNGSELLHGFRDFALQEFGPMSLTLLNEWGIHQCTDLGEMVFHLIEEGMFGKQDSDSQEDFNNVFSFYEAFEAPFLPNCALASSDEEMNPSAA